MMNAEVRIRDGHTQHVRRGKSLPFPPLNMNSASHGSSPGVLVYSHTQQLLHMNRRALHMTGPLCPGEDRPTTMTLSNALRPSLT